MKLKVSVALLGVLLGCSAIAKTSIDDGVVRDIYGLESIFVEQQYQILPISPPSEKVFIHEFKIPVAVDFRKWPREAAVQLFATMEKVDGSLFPVYEIFAYEDPSVFPREVVFENSFGTEIYRLPISIDGYDPLEWQTLRFGEVLDDPAMRWVFDPAHIAVRFVALIPEIFHTDYLAAQGLVVPETMALTTLSIPALPENTNTTSGSGSSSTNMPATLVFTVDENFGASFAQIFQKTNLLVGAADWSVLAENVIVTAGTERTWTDWSSSNIWTRFYILNDPSKDFDGDFLNDGMEVFVTRSDPSVADSDGGQIPDGYEWASGLDPNDSSDDAAALSAYLAVAGDPDGDLSPDWVETRDGTNPNDYFD